MAWFLHLNHRNSFSQFCPKIVASVRCFSHFEVCFTVIFFDSQYIWMFVFFRVFTSFAAKIAGNLPLRSAGSITVLTQSMWSKHEAWLSGCLTPEKICPYQISFHEECEDLKVSSIPWFSTSLLSSDLLITLNFLNADKPKWQVGIQAFVELCDMESNLGNNSYKTTYESYNHKWKHGWQFWCSCQILRDKSYDNVTTLCSGSNPELCFFLSTFRL